MSEENKALVRRWFEEVWNKGRSDAIDEMFAADGVVHGLSDDAGHPLRGPADFKPFHEIFRGAFPDINVVVEEAIAEGDLVAARCSVRGQHTGGHLGVAPKQCADRVYGNGDCADQRRKDCRRLEQLRLPEDEPADWAQMTASYAARAGIFSYFGE